MDASLRITALDTAARLGLPHDMTLRAARAYLAFLEGREPEPSIWQAVQGWAPLAAEAKTAARAVQTSINKLKTKQATRKRPAPKRRAKAA